MRAIAGVTLALLLFPAAAFAQPFGGPITQIIFCYNQAIYTVVGKPRGGIYIWTPGTKTYPFGPPARTGQYLLGLYGAPYYCLVSIVPIVVYPGISITMMGSSGGSAQPSTVTPNPTPVFPSTEPSGSSDPCAGRIAPMTVPNPKDPCPAFR